MKKMILLTIGVLILTGCSLKMTPSDKVEALLNKYVSNDTEIMKELDSYIKEQELTDTQKEKYKDIVKNEYSTMKYDIKDEKIDDETALVTVDITVKDLYKASEEASLYLQENPQEFYTDGEYDKEKFVDYKLKAMEKTKDTVDYTIDFTLTKIKNKWVIDDLNNETLEKIHGIYNYEVAK